MGGMQVIRCIDFGEASSVTAERRALSTPRLLRAPESFFIEGIGLPADIWTVDCTVFSIFARASLFRAFQSDQYSALFELVLTLGNLPERWRDQWSGWPYFFNDDGSVKPNVSITGEELAQKKLDMRIERI